MQCYVLPTYDLFFKKDDSKANNIPITIGKEPPEAQYTLGNLDAKEYTSESQSCISLQISETFKKTFEAKSRSGGSDQYKNWNELDTFCQNGRCMWLVHEHMSGIDIRIWGNFRFSTWANQRGKDPIYLQITQYYTLKYPVKYTPPRDFSNHYNPKTWSRKNEARHWASWTSKGLWEFQENMESWIRAFIMTITSLS